MNEHPVTTSTSSDADAHGDHHGSLKTYFAVFVALCVLTSASFFTYSDFFREHFTEHTGWAFMMAVSCTKAMLVILFFMHLKYEASWKYVLTIPAGFMSIFLVLMLVPDVGLRMRRASEERRHYMADWELHNADWELHDAEAHTSHEPDGAAHEPDGGAAPKEE